MGINTVGGDLPYLGAIASIPIGVVDIEELMTSVGGSK